MRKEELVQKLEQQLQLVKAERLAAKRDPSMLAARIALKRYQSARLADTHFRLLAVPDTCAAAEFFLEELYGAHDMSQRDIDLGRIIPTMQRMLGYAPLHAITEAIVLDALSERLDTAMARRLGTDFDEAQYIEAYRQTARTDREDQLALVQGLGQALCELVRVPLLSATLAIMRGPARMAGLGQLQQFLERGFSTFKKMRDARRFVDDIVSSERRVMEKIYAHDPQPFAL